MISGLKPYLQMKDSGVPWLGEVPEHWEVRKVREVGRVINGFPFDAGRFSQSTGYPLIRIRDLDRARTATRYDGPFIESARVNPGDVLIGMDGDFNVGTWRGAEPALLNQRMCCIRSAEPVTERLLAYLLPGPLKQINDVTWSTTVKHLASSQVERIQLGLPPLPEQTAIVRFLDHADRRIRRYIRAKQKLIKLLEEQKAAIIHRAVTRGLDPNVRLKPSGVEWLGDVPEHWEVWQIGHFARVGNGSTPSRGNTSYWSGGTYPWLNSSSVNAGTVTTSDQYVTEVALRECHLPRVPAGSVLVAITGQGKTRGKTAVLSIEATINQHIAFITLRKPGEIVTAEYLQKFLVAAYAELRRMSDDSGSTKGALTCEDLRHLRVVLPPIPAQEAILQSIGDGLAEVERALRFAESEINLLHEYRTRLIADVVTGKLDVREAAARLPQEAEEPEPLEETEALGEMEGESAADDLEPESQEADA